VVSKLWLNLLIWGLGDRLEKRDDYKTDLLLVVDLMAWYSLLSLSLRSGANLLLLWLLAPLANTPLTWIVTQLVLGYLMVRYARQHSQTRKVVASKEGISRPAGVSDSEEP
jgi:hypothetical protein